MILNLSNYVTMETDTKQFYLNKLMQTRRNSENKSGNCVTYCILTMIILRGRISLKSGEIKGFFQQPGRFHCLTGRLGDLLIFWETPGNIGVLESLHHTTFQSLHLFLVLQSSLSICCHHRV